MDEALLDPIKCPQCTSTQIETSKDKRNKIFITCIKCGHELKPGDNITNSIDLTPADNKKTIGFLLFLVIVASVFFIYKGCGNEDPMPVVATVTESISPVVLSKSDSIKEAKQDSLDGIEYAKQFKIKMDNSRNQYVTDLRNRFLDAGLDIKCYDEKNKLGRTLKLQFSLFNDVWKRKFEKEKILNEAFSYFTKIILTDGYGYNAVIY
jgi:Zn ribbon nucleic-acid-binding protein